MSEVEDRHLLVVRDFVGGNGTNKRVKPTRELSRTQGGSRGARGFAANIDAIETQNCHDSWMMPSPLLIVAGLTTISSSLRSTKRRR